MKQILPLFVFIDACGWEIIKNRPFLTSLAPNRRKLESVFGYSSACVPSILSGRWPVEHRNWCYFVHDPGNSPFRSLRPLQWLPTSLTSRRIFRRQLSRFIKAKLNFRGYFDLYNIPFRHISLYDFTEKRSPLQPGGMNRGKNIFDHLREEEISYHVSDPARTEEQNLHKLLDDITQERIEFAFLYWPGLDGLMHMEGNDSPQVGVKLRQYEAWIQHLVETTARHYSEAPLYVFSDHGMANCDKVIDLRSQIEALPLQLGPDYAAVYDSTMARFWFFSPTARQMVEQLLAGISEGRILPDSELEGLGTLFPDRYFGELIFLVREGVLIVPSDMGERPIRAMHGYHPSEPQSYAVLCANQPELPVTVDAIPDMFQIMLTEARVAKEKNERRGQPAPQRETAG